MKKFLAFFLVASLLCACAAVLPSCGKNDDDRIVTIENDVIKIGVLGPFEGATTGKYGMPARDALKLAAEQYNAKEGHKYTIEVLEKNTQGDATAATTMFNELIEAGVAAIVGPILTGEATAATTIANEQNVVMVSPSATGNTLTTESDFVYRTCFKDEGQAVAAANYAKKLGYTKVAVIYATGDDYSRGLYESFKAQCEKNGITIVSTQTSQTIDAETTFQTQLTAIAATDAQMLYAPYYYEAVDTLIVPVIRAMGFDKIIMGADGYDGSMGSAQDKSVYNKVVFTNHYDASLASIQQFTADYNAKNYPSPLNVFGGLAYDAANLLFAAIENAVKVDDEGVKTLSGKDLKNAIDTFGAFNGVTGTFTLDETGTKPADDIVILEYFYDEQTGAVTVAAEIESKN